MQLYNLARDPAEKDNLFGRDKGIVRELTEFLDHSRWGAG
jgi:hypothetical protein